MIDIFYRYHPWFFLLTWRRAFEPCEYLTTDFTDSTERSSVDRLVCPLKANRLFDLSPDVHGETENGNTYHKDKENGRMDSSRMDL
jgi:hypothetical protein